MKLDWMIWSSHLEVGRLGVRLAADRYTSCGLCETARLFLLVGCSFNLMLKRKSTVAGSAFMAQAACLDPKFVTGTGDFLFKPSLSIPGLT